MTSPFHPTKGLELVVGTTLSLRATIHIRPVLSPFPRKKMTRERVRSPLLVPPPAPGPARLVHVPSELPVIVARLLKFRGRLYPEHPHRDNYPAHYFTCAACGTMLVSELEVRLHHVEHGHSAFTGIRFQRTELIGAH